MQTKILSLRLQHPNQHIKGRCSSSIMQVFKTGERLRKAEGFFELYKIIKKIHGKFGNVFEKLRLNTEENKF